MIVDGSRRSADRASSRKANADCSPDQHQSRRSRKTTIREFHRLFSSVAPAGVEHLSHIISENAPCHGSGATRAVLLPGRLKAAGPRAAQLHLSSSRGPRSLKGCLSSPKSVFFRRRWDDGLGQRVVRVELHGEKRVFRGSDPGLIEKTLRGKKLLGSETRGKQIAVQFSKGAWLGLHLGMSGKLRVEAADFAPRKHDHLALFLKPRTLVFSDPRMFGRVRFHVGSIQMPDWWTSLPPAVTSREFTVARLPPDSAAPPGALR